MSLRSYLDELERLNETEVVTTIADTRFEIAGVLKALENRPVHFRNVPGCEFSVAGNLLASKEGIARHFGIEVDRLIQWIAKGIDQPSPPRRVRSAPCQEVEMNEIDLDRLPILLHGHDDGGRYITSGVCVARHPDLGQNLDFHRAMQIGKDRLALRIVRHRDFDRFLRDQQEMDVAICIGNGPNVLLAAATSVAGGGDELEIANTLEALDVTRAKSADLWIPADCEIVLEGKVRLDDRASEGPFVDLTETLDVVRTEPVMTVTRITHRRDAIWQALLPGGLEHKLLMGMPREPTIYRNVREAGVNCRDVSITPGGCSWLHAIIKIRKTGDDDVAKALDAAFAGHRSLKHAFVVDEDIDILDPIAVEWAFATRFQFDRDVYPREIEAGSSLDPSAEPGTKRTAKVGFDLTVPSGTESAREKFEHARFPRVDLKRFLDRQ